MPMTFKGNMVLENAYKEEVLTMTLMENMFIKDCMKYTMSYRPDNGVNDKLATDGGPDRGPLGGIDDKSLYEKTDSEPIQEPRQVTPEQMQSMSHKFMKEILMLKNRITKLEELAIQQQEETDVVTRSELEHTMEPT